MQLFLVYLGGHAMAKKTLSIAEQIVDLETDLEEKNEILKEYDKIFDRYLKLLQWRRM